LRKLFINLSCILLGVKVERPITRVVSGPRGPRGPSGALGALTTNCFITPKGTQPILPILKTLSFPYLPMLFSIESHAHYTLSEAWSGVNWADLMAAQGAFETDFYDRSILRLKHRAYCRSGRPVIKIGPKGALGSHEIRPIHSAPSLGQSIQISS